MIRPTVLRRSALFSTRASRRCLSGSIAALTVIFLGALPEKNAAQAADWTGATSNNWFTAGNWNPAAVPGAAVTVTINLAGANFSLIDAAGSQASKVTLGSVAGLTGELRVAGDGRLTVGSSGIAVGDFGAGKVTISGSGQVTTPYLLLANNLNSQGTMLVTGANSKLTTGGLDVAYDVGASGTITVEAGAKMEISGTMMLGNFSPTSSATLTITGTGSNLTTTSNLSGFYLATEGQGTFNVLAGATAVTDRNVGVASYTGAGAVGTVTVDGAGSSWTTARFQIGGTGTGQMTISGGGAVSSGLGASTPSGTVFINKATVTVKDPGSIWRIGGLSGLLSLALSGTAAVPAQLNIENGGQVIVQPTATNAAFADVRLGSGANTVGALTIDGVGSTLTTPYNLYLGYSTNSKGTITVRNGGALNSGYAVISLTGDATATTADAVTVTGAGSLWTISDTVSALPNAAKGLSIGNAGRGTLTIADGGTVRLANPAASVTIGLSSTSQGTLNIGAANGDTAVAPGTLDASKVVFATTAPGPLTINFNHTSANYTFAPQITGNGPGIVNVLAGTTILTAGNTYLGQTNVLGGRLIVDGSLGNTPVRIASGATLGGTGTIGQSAPSQMTTLESGGTIAPGPAAGGVGTLRGQSLTWNPGGLFQFDLGPGSSADRLTLSGTFNGNGAGTYAFGFNFDPNDHSIVGQTFTLVSFASTNFNAADFPSATTYQIGNVQLIGGFVLGATTLKFTSLALQLLGDQYWDGAGTTGNSLVDGGAGTWNITTTNWTNVVGTSNAAWGGGTAIFSGAAGTVTLGANLTFGGLKFQTAGYVIAPDGGGVYALTPATDAIIRTDADATINAPLKGNGSIIKEGANALTLAGANAYTGGTTLNDGTLIAGSDQAFGTGAVTINGGTLGSVTSGVGVTRTLANDLFVNASFSTQQNGVHFILGGDVMLATTATITNTSPGTAVVFAGAITGPGGVTFIRSGVSGEFDLTGTASNSYAGPTRVESAFVALGKTGGMIAIPGDLTITGDGVVDLAFGQSEQIADTATVTVESGGKFGDQGFDLHGQTETIGTLNGSSAGTVGLGGGQLVVGAGDFAGVIKDGLWGPGGQLVKTGPGILTLTGANTYTGETTVKGGTLIVDGSLASTTTTIQTAGTLAGLGTIGGQLVNNGLISPGHSPGTLTVTGNFTQNSGGTLRIEIAGRNPAEHDLLAIGGSAALGGTLQLVRLNNFQLQAGDHLTFLTAAGGVTGTFGTLSNDFATGTAVSGQVVYSATEVALIAAQESFVAVPELIAEQFPELAREFSFLRNLTPNQHAVAQNLDRVIGDRRAAKLIDYLNHRWLPELPGDFDRIAPEELTAIYQTAISLATIQSLNLQRRTDDLRSGANGFSAQGLAINGQTPSYSGNFDIQSGVAGPTGDTSKDSKMIYSPAPDNRWGVFLSGTGEWIDVDGDGNARGYDITTGGFTLGVDYKVTPNLAVGISAGYAGTEADLTNDGRVWVNGGKLGLYATWFTGGFYTDLAVNGGYNSYDTKRGGLEGTARGSTEGGELNVLFGTGYDFKIGALTVGPTATFNYTYLGMDSFDERGSLAPLHFGDQSAESIRSTFGFKASYDWKIGGVIIRPELRAAWQHEYGDDDYALDSKFANGAGNTFTVRGPRIGRDSLLLGGGVAVQINDRVSTYLYYDGQIARENYDSHSVTGGVRVAF